MIITNLLTNMVVVGMTGYFPTNYSAMPVYREYAFHAMFQQASNLVVNWNLDLPRPITTNMVTTFSTTPFVEGPNGFLIFSNRFLFSWDQGGFEQFHDEPYVEERAETMDVVVNNTVYEQWMRATNLLTMEKARVIAESVMQSVGVPIGKGKFKKPDHMTQMTYTEKEHPMPFYRFRWKTDHHLFCNYEVQVSGITSNVIDCFFFPGSPYVKSLHPTNYFEMLGLPHNPVFVFRDFTPHGQLPVYKTYSPW